MADSDVMKLKVVGDHTMHCSGCESTVRYTLSRLPRVREVKADHRSQLIEIELDRGGLDLEKVRAELEWIGYEVELA